MKKLTGWKLTTVRVLVLLASDAAKEKYSQFLEGLSGAGFDVDAKAYKDASLKLREYDSWFYDHLIILTPKAECACCWGRKGRRRALPLNPPTPPRAVSSPI